MKNSIQYILFLVTAILLTGCVVPLPPASLTAIASTAQAEQPVEAASPVLIPTTEPAEEPSSQNDAVVETENIAVNEAPIVEIPLPSPLDGAELEYSGMAWYGDTLVLLPQYPDRHGDFLPTLARDEIVAYLSGERDEPPAVDEMSFDDGGLPTMVTGFDGFEAIAFDGDQAYLTIETRPGNWMLGYVVAGTVSPDGSSLILDPMQRAPAPAQAALGNMTDETLVIDGQRLITIYEANGANIIEQPTASIYSKTVEKLDPIAFPNVEYRITDATDVDDQRRFWAINYFFPGDEKLNPATDPIVEQYGQGPSHQGSPTIERLVEFQIDENGINLVETPPIQLTLSRLGLARNWEGLVRLEEGDVDGFLLVTDKFPSTILAFVPRDVN